MKHLKTFKIFESQFEPEIGDYVICRTFEDDYDTSLLENEIGQIVNIEYDNQIKSNEYFIKFDPDGPLKDLYFFDTIYNNKPIEPGTLVFNRDEILKISKNKEELELFINANKYNL